VVVPVNAMNKAEEFGHYIVDPGTRVVICGAELAGIVAAANAVSSGPGGPACVWVMRAGRPARGRAWPGRA